jgi:hypothetical protein
MQQLLDKWERLRKSEYLRPDEKLMLNHCISDLKRFMDHSVDANEMVGKQQTRPPLGLMPHSVFLLRRLEEIFEAIERYHEASMQIPIEWIQEYNLLIEMYKNNLVNK